MDETKNNKQTDRKTEKKKIRQERMEDLQEAIRRKQRELRDDLKYQNKMKRTSSRPSLQEINSKQSNPLYSSKSDINVNEEDRRRTRRGNKKSSTKGKRSTGKDRRSRKSHQGKRRTDSEEDEQSKLKKESRISLYRIVGAVTLLVVIVIVVVLIIYLLPRSERKNKSGIENDTVNKTDPWNGFGTGSWFPGGSQNGSKDKTSTGYKFLTVNNNVTVNGSLPYIRRFVPIQKQCTCFADKPGNDDFNDWYSRTTQEDYRWLLRDLEESHRQIVYFWTKFGLLNGNITSYFATTDFLPKRPFVLFRPFLDVSGVLTELNIANFKWLGMGMEKGKFQKVVFEMCLSRFIHTFLLYSTGKGVNFLRCPFTYQLYDVVKEYPNIPPIQPKYFPHWMRNCHPDLIKTKGYIRISKLPEFWGLDYQYYYVDDPKGYQTVREYATAFKERYNFNTYNLDKSKTHDYFDWHYKPNKNSSV